MSDRLKFPKRASRLLALSASFEFELACPSPSISLVFVYSQKFGRRVEHHLSKRDRCSQEEGFFSLSLVSAVRGDFFQVIDVPVLAARSHVACLSNPSFFFLR